MSTKLKTQLADMPTSLPSPVRPRFWVRPILVIAAALLVQGALRPTPVQAPTPEHALTEDLARDFDLSASPSDVFWVDPPPSWRFPWRSGRVWVLGAHPGGLDDVYLVRATRTPEGQLLDVQAAHGMTDTKAATETHLTALGNQAAWLTGTESDLLRLTWARLDHSPLEAPNAAPMTFTQRLQWHLTWLQELGEWRGVGRRSFKLVPPSRQAFLEFTADQLVLQTEQGRVTLDGPTNGEGRQHVSEQRVGLAKPGNLVTWCVDRLRAMAWFGDENMQRLKAVAYRVWDTASRHLGLGADSGETQVTVVAAAARAEPSPSDNTPARAAAAEPEQFRRAWPPPDLTPLLSPAEPAEGVWVSLAGDPFIKPSRDPAGLFYTTFLRTDPERTYSRILVTAWDPLTVALHTQSGTEEPKSATGETGTGLVPRESAAVDLVAAFNGGFQATHGDFGMMADGVLYVPPLPFAATVAVDEAGRLGFGTWPADSAVPKNLVGLRQNLTPLVAGGLFNPYQRTWWGGVPSGWEDDTRTVRSGICLTSNGLVLYFYGAKVDAENLAKAMLAAACTYGLHLDMNQGHTGLEFYHVAKEQELPPLALNLDGVWQAEGPVPDAPGLAFRGRRMFRAMQLMNFPRYIQRETRDFFYLTERRSLPRGGNTSDWRIPPTARRVYPPALAVRSHTPPDATATLVQLIELDPQFFVPEVSGTASLSVAEVVTRDVPEENPQGRNWLLWTDGHLSWGPLESRGPGVALLPEATDVAVPEAMVCISPDTGRLLFGEIVGGVDPSKNAAILENTLTAEGCPRAHLHPATAGRFEVEGRDLSGHPMERVHSRLSLAYRRPVRHFALFPDTPVVPPATWKPLQAKRD